MVKGLKWIEKVRYLFYRLKPVLQIKKKWSQFTFSSSHVTSGANKLRMSSEPRPPGQCGEGSALHLAFCAAGGEVPPPSPHQWGPGLKRTGRSGQVPPTQEPQPKLGQGSEPEQTRKKKNPTPIFSSSNRVGMYLRAKLSRDPIEKEFSCY